MYGLTSVLVGLTGALGNGLVIANLPYLQGPLQLNSSEVAWLPASYLMTTAIAGSVLVKYRQLFGIRSFCMVFLAIQVLLIAAHLSVQGLESAVAIRAASGVCGSALLSLGVFYMIQAFPVSRRLSAVALGIGIPQLALPLARLFPKDDLAFDNWRGLTLFELGLSVVTLAVVMLVRLPPNKRENTFEPLDAFTFLLYAAGVGLLGSSLGLGGYLWWTNEAWIGIALATAIPCLAVVLVMEYFRSNPLIDVRWLSSATFIRWSLVAIVWRVAIAEQSIGVIGMLRDFGLTNDELSGLSIIIFLSAVAGLLTAAVVISAKRLPQMVMIALSLVATAAFVDSFSGMDSRVPQFLLTQGVVAFATTMFIGPSFIFGLSRVITEGGAKMTSFVALFGITQAIGTLAGTAFVQSYLFYSQQLHLSDFANQAPKSSALVAQLFFDAARRYGTTIADPVLRSGEVALTFAQQTLLAARVAAYNDVFFAISIIAALAAALVGLATLCVPILGLITGRTGQ
ncbi:MAG: hypothetical protein AAAB20_31200 [Rhizobium sp.]|uniref:hypothetical protein n=1 Tax=Rhizobium sp. TaxID=391 RepID=UPI0030F107EE